MTDKELIRKIQSLKQIEPRKDWVLLTKNQILGEAEHLSQPVLRWWPKVNLSIFLKPAVVVPVVLLLIGGGIFYFANLGGLLTSQTKVAELEQSLAQLEELTPALEQLQADLSQIKQNLDGAQIKDPKMVLGMREGVEATAENVRKIAAETRKVVENATTTSGGLARGLEREKVLTSIIAEIEKASGDLEKSYQEKVKETVEYLIGEIEHWSLGENDQQIFSQAKEAYWAGDYNQALEDILSLGR
ncbi:MAG: hypothetical protein A2172_02795 [Candidatus Woykebacteria bacterium RBG_13_40_15]|uniref:DUF5667 domain-containing protein n=1 Tax=Candidatus Woykebacteria bacterium RBG_13_40_15 TaxID=1802593 RepID=A0A1G1W8K9_9BACT|nr:MAG: hypothetical protein A2172_02795 [Candidatus Woykebacteria bacterium RBG_13_40_15]